MPVTTTRCPRCSRPLLGDREVPLPFHFLPGGKVDAERRAHARKYGRPAPRALPIHDAAACARYLAAVLTDCAGYVAHAGGDLVTVMDRGAIRAQAIRETIGRAA